jgi:hypothetical protein
LQKYRTDIDSDIRRRLRKYRPTSNPSTPSSFRQAEEQGHFRTSPSPLANKRGNRPARPALVSVPRIRDPRSVVTWRKGQYKEPKHIGQATGGVRREQRSVRIRKFAAPVKENDHKWTKGESIKEVNTLCLLLQDESRFEIGCLSLPPLIVLRWQRTVI